MINRILKKFTVDKLLFNKYYKYSDIGNHLFF